MSKVKVVTREVKEKELNLEYPIFLYFQDELCYDELVAILDEKCKITVKYDTFGFIVTYEHKFWIDDGLINERNFTTKKHFNEVYKDAMKFIGNKLYNNE